MKFLIALFVALINYFQLSVCIDCSISPMTTEARLRQKLLCSYDKEIRPTVSSGKNTFVQILLHIFDYDYLEYDKKFSMGTRVAVTWRDNRFVWKPSEYDGIHTIAVRITEIWVPDIGTYNRHETTKLSEYCSETSCRIANNGDILCVSPCQHTATCFGNYANWPFDTKACTLFLGLWNEENRGVIMTTESIDLDDYEPNRKWKLIAMKLKNRGSQFLNKTFLNETHSSSIINILIQRHSSSHTAFIVVPACVLIVMNLMSLWLSPNCSERIILVIISLFCHFMCQQQLSWQVPKDAESVPRALTYFRDSMVISTILLLQTIILRGLLICKIETPTCILAITENRLCKLVDSNSYLINKPVMLNNQKLFEEELKNVEQGPISNKKSKAWITIVRIVDIFMFLAVLISYVILLMAWIPSSIFLKEIDISKYITPD